ncbi:MAG: hypothetical protein AAF566_02400 [Pseudomonadota bacterium]
MTFQIQSDPDFILAVRAGASITPIETLKMRSRNGRAAEVPSRALPVDLRSDPAVTARRSHQPRHLGLRALDQLCEDLCKGGSRTVRETNTGATR